MEVAEAPGREKRRRRELKSAPKSMLGLRVACARGVGRVHARWLQRMMDGNKASERECGGGVAGAGVKQAAT